MIGTFGLHVSNDWIMKNTLNIPWDEITLLDAARLRAALERAQRAHGDHREALMNALGRRAESARTVVERRRKGRPPVIAYPGELPVSQAREEIMRQVREHAVVIVCGDTGSGKTTQLPKMLLEMGCGIRGRIGCTQPRRLAAVSMAKRVADELGVPLKGTVGYQVRFDESFSAQTSIKFMTDGILLAEMPHDRLWMQYDALIIDEAHERSLNIDFILGCLKRLLEQRADLKVVISSATLDAERFSAFFNGAPIVRVEGRRFPVEDFYLPPNDEDEDLERQVLRGIDWITDVDAAGDVLVFLPGEREIHDVAELLRGRRWAHTEILPLYARLSLSEQQKVFTVGGRRRIVLSTNVAETSLTIPAIRYVVDSGLVRLLRFDPRFQVERLQLEMVSQASANQRRGRCGRVCDGICIRLYARETLEESEAFTPPEIQRTSLADVILRMKVSALPDLEEFPFIDPPRVALIREGYRTLMEIGALDEGRQLTRLGRALGRFQADPRIARMIVQGYREGCLEDVLTVTSALSIQDPRERPPDQREKADQAQRVWRDARSDFMTLLNLWKDWQGLKERSVSNSGRRRFCREHFLSMRRMMEWENLRREWSEQAGQLDWAAWGIHPAERDAEGERSGKERTTEERRYAAIHRSILSGIPMQIGEKDEGSAFRGTRDRAFVLFPGSSVFGRPPPWLMAFELVETTRLYARQAAAFSPEWVEQTAPHVCRAVYADPAWDAKNGFVYAKKSVMCGGLTLIEGQRVHYGPVDPAAARELFIMQGLIPAQMTVRHAWLREYRALLERVRGMEVKRRRPESLLNVYKLHDWFDQRLPREVYTAKDFDQWLLRHAESLHIHVDELVPDHDWTEEARKYPDTMVIEGVVFPLRYCFAPGEAGDGVRVECPADRIALITQAHLDWLIPGWLEEKILVLLRSLTKRIRLPLNPLAETAAFLAGASLPGAFTGYGPEAERREEEDDEVRPLRVVLADYVRGRLGEIVGPGDFDESKMPGWMRMRVDVRDADGRPLICTDDLDAARAACARTSLENAGSRAPSAPKPRAPEREKPAGRGESGGTDEAARAVRWFAAHYGEQMRAMEKRLVLSMQARLFLTSECKCPDPMRDLIDGAVLSLMTEANHGRVPETEEDVRRVAEKVRSECYGRAEEGVKQLEQVIRSWHESWERLLASRLESGPAGEDVLMQRRELFYPGFMKSPTELADYVRWMKALKIRAERAQYDAQKDAQKQGRLLPFRSRIYAALELLEKTPSRRTRELAALLQLWQEWRVQIFAQEAGTRIRVSEKILHESLTNAGV